MGWAAGAQLALQVRAGRGQLVGSSTPLCTTHPPIHPPARLPARHPRRVGFGLLGAFIGGANVIRGASRVVIGGWIALAIVYGIGKAFNVSSG